MPGREVGQAGGDCGDGCALRGVLAGRLESTCGACSKRSRRAPEQEVRFAGASGLEAGNVGSVHFPGAKGEEQGSVEGRGEGDVCGVLAAKVWLCGVAVRTGQS